MENIFFRGGRYVFHAVLVSLINCGSIKKRQTFQENLFFVVSFFSSSCCLIFSTTILDCASFASFNHTPYPKSELFLVVIVVFFIIFQSRLFLLPCFHCCLLISLMGMMVCLLAASLAMAWRVKIPGENLNKRFL